MQEGIVDVVMVETTEGPKAAVIATHPLIGEGLLHLLTVIEEVSNNTPESETTKGLHAIFTAYEQFVTTPERIVEQSAMEESPTESGTEYE